MKTFTIEDIRAFDPKPCYDPGRYLPENWKGTALDILRVTDAPAEDRLWVVCHPGWASKTVLRLFAVWCARRAMAGVENPDPRSVSACDVAERYANGEATPDELLEAWGEAWGAVMNAILYAIERGAVHIAYTGAAWNSAASISESSAWWASCYASRVVPSEERLDYLITLLQADDA